MGGEGLPTCLGLGTRRNLGPTARHPAGAEGGVSHQGWQASLSRWRPSWPRGSRGREVFRVGTPANGCPMVCQPGSQRAASPVAILSS